MAEEKNTHEDLNIESEIDDLKMELEHFQAEKERVRQIVGKIGGVPRFNTKLINVLFIIAVALPIIVSFFIAPKWQPLMIEISLISLSLKIIYLIHSQTKVNHFKFWILSSIEWRLTELRKDIKKIKEQIDER